MHRGLLAAVAAGKEAGRVTDASGLGKLSISYPLEHGQGASGLGRMTVDRIVADGLEMTPEQENRG